MKPDRVGAPLQGRLRESDFTARIDDTHWRESRTNFVPTWSVVQTRLTQGTVPYPTEFLTAGAVAASATLAAPTAVAAAGGSAALTGTPLRIGVLLDLSGPGRIQGRRQLLGIEHQQRLLDRAAGDPLRLIVVDTRGERARTRTEAERLARQRLVDALVGTSAPGTSSVVAEIGESAEIPVVMPSAGAAPTQAYVFRSGLLTSVATTRMFQALARADLRRVAALSTVSTSPPSAWNAFREEMALHRLKLTDHQEFRPSDGDLRTPLETLLATQPEVLTVFTAPPYNGVAVREARALGWSGPIFCSPAAGHPQFATIAGVAAEGTRVIAPWVLVARDAPATLPNGWAMREFVSTFEVEHGPAGTYAAYGADAITMLHRAFYGHRSRLRARTELESMVHVGIAGVSTMAPAKHAALTLDCLTVAEWRRGQWRAVPGL